MAKCGVQHPEDASRTCLRAPGFHPEHADVRGQWPNNAPGVSEEVARIKAASKRRGRQSSAKERRALAAAAAKSRIEKLAKERDAAKAGMQTALEGASEDFRENFLAAVYALAQQVQTLTSDDVWAVLDDWGVDTDSRAAVGPLMASAAKHGWTEKTDQRAVSARPGSKARDGLTVWRSLVFGGMVTSPPSGEKRTGQDTSILSANGPRIWGPSS